MATSTIVTGTHTHGSRHDRRARPAAAWRLHEGLTAQGVDNRLWFVDGNGHSDSEPGIAGALRAEADRIADALAAHDWKIRQAAEALGIGRNTLKRRMAALGLKRPGDLEAAEIRSAIETEGNLVAAARALRVSEAGLRRRMSELGLS